MSVTKVCVYCASSNKCDELFLKAAEKLGEILARNGKTVVYGGGGSGLMGRLADGVLKNGGTVLGIIPNFMQELEWAHTKLTELRLVSSMHERKFMMMQESDGIVALPGGSGTFEELLEAITWKRLGLITSPIVIANLNNYYAPMIEMLEQSVEKKFMRQEHLKMWVVVNSVEEIVPALENAAPWSEDARNIAAV
ncbi:MAG TPA: TIGR00730 family Rossman fold protein [Patescibacteria group bacterium]|nr:TIGR00730 family Rossman fold protein [Patescibacteria group bacterium]